MAKTTIRSKRKVVIKMRTVQGKTLVTVNGDDGIVEFSTLTEAHLFVRLLDKLCDIGKKNVKRLNTRCSVTTLVPKPPVVKRVIFTDSGEEVLA